MSRAAGGALAYEADWLCVYIHVCCADVAPHTSPSARTEPPTAPPSVTDAERPVRVEQSTSDGHIQRGSQGQPSRLCIPCIHKAPEAAERVLAYPVCGSVLRPERVYGCGQEAIVRRNRLHTGSYRTYFFCS